MALQQDLMMKMNDAKDRPTELSIMKKQNWKIDVEQTST